ncbi:MAG: hypothetical protein HYZ08_01310 [Candidatus Kerfeldbacteria bacterium]|nr:hypothetical protein [Candidatus Kerfeldbacteria bacterium]
MKQRMFQGGLIALGLGLLMLSPLATSAVSLAERDESAVQDYRNARTTYRQEVQKYTSARATYVQSRDKYRNGKTNENLQVVLDDAKDFLLQSGTAAISYLEMLKTKVESMRGITDADRQATLAEINEDITFFQNKKTEVQNATTKDELVTLATQIRDHWNTVRVDTKKIVGRVLAARVNYILTEMNTLSSRVDSKIETLSSQGVDVVELSQLNNTFKADIAVAETAYDNAVAKFNAISNLEEANTLFEQGRDFIQDADEALRKAHADLKEIVKKIKSTPIRSAEEAGTGVLNASGAGTATLDGEGTVEGSTDAGGRLIVTDNGKDATIDTGGTGTREVLADGRIQYTGITKNIRVTGSDIVVEITGSQITFKAEGTGTVTLKGDGTYTVGKSGTKRTYTATPVQINIQ